MQIKAAFDRGSRVGIIGAGWIGLETAAAVRGAGLDVTVLEQAELPLVGCSAPGSPECSRTCTAPTGWTCA